MDEAIGHQTPQYAERSVVTKPDRREPPASMSEQLAGEQQST
jgi:hypothetical protein